MKKTGKQVCVILSVIFVLSAGVFAFRRMHTLASFAGLSATQQIDMIRVYCSGAGVGTYTYRARRNTAITNEQAGREWTRFLFYEPVKLYPIENAPYLGSLSEKATLVEISLAGLPEGHPYESRILLNIMEDGKCGIFLPYTEKESLTHFGRTGEMEARWFELPDDMYFTKEYLDKLVCDRTDGWEKDDMNETEKERKHTGCFDCRFCCFNLHAGDYKPVKVCCGDFFC